MSHRLKVAIIDTGMDVEHPYLKAYAWKNPGEHGLDKMGRPKTHNGVDDDNNGYIDDLHGWNFAEMNSDVSDSSTHGTHVAGLIRSVVAQSVPQVPVEFMVLKYFKKGMSVQEQRVAFLKALQYAVRMKADIINVSAGGPEFSTAELKVLREAHAQGTLVIAAAGNKKKDDPYFAFYPAAYSVPNVFSVVATDKKGRPLATSNLNPGKSNVLALGKKLRSSLPGNLFGIMSGSSQATALVTGNVIAQMLERKDLGTVEVSGVLEAPSPDMSNN